jgi:hypothetical protein
MSTGTWKYCINAIKLSDRDFAFEDTKPHSYPPLITLIVAPKPCLKPAAKSALFGYQKPVMMSCILGFGL